jgi:hypothetical protein
MLAFVVPLKSAQISRNWALACRLFERCLRAICNQTSPQFRVVVVCNERPTVSFSHPNVHYLEVDFPPPLPDPTETRSVGYELSRSKDIERKNADKARKLRTGLEYARRYQPTHSMVVDADDCVSRRLAKFVEQNPESPGWYFQKGYIHTEGSRFMHLNSRNFNVVCGTSVVIAYERYHLLFANPDFYQHAFEEPMASLTPLPFPGAVYSMANGDNIYMSAETRDQIYATLFGRLFSPRVFSVFRKVLSYWPTLLTRSRRAEFGLYRLPEVPPPAARAGDRTAQPALP